MGFRENKVFFLCIILLLVSSLHGSFVIRDEFTKVYDVAFGETIRSSINIYNPTDEIVQIKVYQADYAHTQKGDDYFLEPGKYNRSNANWVNYSEFIQIRPNENADFNFSITAPIQRDLGGTYWSVLFFEEVTSLSPIKTEEITIDYRYCIQLITNLKNTGTIDMSFVDVTYIDNSVMLSLKNIGSLWFEATIKIDIFNQNAELINSKISERHRIYPELEKQYKILIDNLNPTNYYAIIMVDCGETKVFGHQISFSVR